MDQFPKPLFKWTRRAKRGAVGPKCKAAFVDVAFDTSPLSTQTGLTVTVAAKPTSSAALVTNSRDQRTGLGMYLSASHIVCSAASLASAASAVCCFAPMRRCMVVMGASFAWSVTREVFAANASTTMRSC